MTNDFKPTLPFVPKTETRIFLGGRPIDQQVEQSNLSSAARSKVINRSGSNYLSENQGNYGPCPDIWNESESGHKFDSGFEAVSVSTKGRAEVGASGGIYASAGVDVSGFRFKDDIGDLKIGSYSASAEAGITGSKASAKYKLGVDVVNVKAAGAKVNVGVDVSSEASIGEGSAKLKVGGLGVSVGKEIGISTPVGGFSVNLEEAAEDCTIQ